MKELSLSLAEEKKLRALIQKKGLSPQQQQRCRILLSLHEGKSPTFIANQFNLSRTTIYNYAHRYQSGNLNSLLKIKDQTGPSPKIDRKKINSVIKKTRHLQSQGKPCSVRKIAQLERISPKSVWKIWKEHKIKSHSSPLSSSSSKKSNENQEIVSIQSQRTRTTLLDIAQKANVSKATVSLALRNHPRISIPTRKKIKKLAQALNYRPNLGLSNLAQMRWKNPISSSNLALISSHSAEGNLFFFDQAKKEAQKLGHALEMFLLEEYASPQALNRILIHRGIQGIILNDIENPNEFKQQFNWRHFSVVTGFQVNPFSHKVGHNQFFSAQQAWQMARKYGYQRIGLVIPPKLKGNKLRDETLGALYYEQSKVPPSQRLPIFPYFPSQKPDLFRHWFKKNKPDALLFSILEWPLSTHPDFLPPSFPYALLARNATTPPHISGIDVCLSEIATATVQLLNAQLKSNQYGLPTELQRLSIPTRWHKGKTLPLKSN